jgi:hypothetical protein
MKTINRWGSHDLPRRRFQVIVASDLREGDHVAVTYYREESSEMRQLDVGYVDRIEVEGYTTWAHEKYHNVKANQLSGHLYLRDRHELDVMAESLGEPCRG